jgi:hypothetical protein
VEKWKRKDNLDEYEVDAILKVTRIGISRYY